MILYFHLFFFPLKLEKDIDKENREVDFENMTKQPIKHRERFGERFLTKHIYLSRQKLKCKFCRLTCESLSLIFFFLDINLEAGYKC